MANDKKTDNRLSAGAAKKLQGEHTAMASTLALIAGMPHVSILGKHKTMAQECLERVANGDVAGVT